MRNIIILPGAVHHEQFRGVLYVEFCFPLYFLLSSVSKWKSHAKNVYDFYMERTQ